MDGTVGCERPSHCNQSYCNARRQASHSFVAIGINHIEGTMLYATPACTVRTPIACEPSVLQVNREFDVQRGGALSAVDIPWVSAAKAGLWLPPRYSCTMRMAFGALFVPHLPRAARLRKKSAVIGPRRVSFRLEEAYWRTGSDGSHR